LKTLLAITALCLGWTPLAASAQTFTVLPVERDARVEPSERMAAFSAVQSSRVLGPSAEFVAVGELSHRLPDEHLELTNCLEVDCAASLARESGLDAVLVVAVWPGEGRRAESVAVTLVEPNGTTHEADAEVGEAGVAQAATMAVVAAARQRTLGDGVELRVGSEPEGALVLVDGTEVGVTPYVGVYEAGEHEVEVRLHGESETRDVELEDDAVELEVMLGEGDDGAASRDGSSGRSLVSMLIPAGFLVGALGAGAVAIGGAAFGSSCEGVDPGTTCSRSNAGAIVAWTVTAVALLGTAVVLWFVLDDSDDSNAARLGIGPTSVTLNVPLDL